MQEFTITWFSNNDATSGTPMTQVYTAADVDEAIAKFKLEHPAHKPWSID